MCQKAELALTYLLRCKFPFNKCEQDLNVRMRRLFAFEAKKKRKFTISRFLNNHRERRSSGSPAITADRLSAAANVYVASGTA